MTQQEYNKEIIVELKKVIAMLMSGEVDAKGFNTRFGVRRIPDYHGRVEVGHDGSRIVEVALFDRRKVKKPI